MTYYTRNVFYIVVFRLFRALSVSVWPIFFVPLPLLIFAVRHVYHVNFIACDLGNPFTCTKLDFWYGTDRIGTRTKFTRTRTL